VYSHGCAQYRCANTAEEAPTTVKAANRHPGRLDAAAPLVLDTRELGRRPGSMRAVNRAAITPHRIGLDLIAVPDGGGLSLELRMESVMEGVLITGTVSAEAVGECSRCLEPLREAVHVALTELYAYPNSATEATTDDDEVRHVVHDLVDLTDAITDAVGLELPLQPLCSPDCPGLCAECGARLAVVGSQHGHETMDPRWAALSVKFGPTAATADAASAVPTSAVPTSTVPIRSVPTSTERGATDVEEM